MDDSTNTPKGRCLIDLLVKGRINSLKLTEDFYNPQRVLIRENLDMNEEVLEVLIITLIYGVISVSANGGPRCRVCARETLRSAPHQQ